MRKGFLFIFLVLIVVNTSQAQTKGTKVGYIDMEYILQNVPDYTEAQNQLEQKAQKWKQEIETKKNEINKLKEALKAEKALLTKGLIEERISEITFLENENLEYQQKRFGPNGDLITQKNALTKPIQDQVFTAVQDIAETKKYDFIFDKTSDMTMLFAAKRFDISDQIVRILNRTEKREQLTKKQLKEEAEKEAKEEAMYDNPELAKKQKSLDAKKAARDAVIANRLLADEERRKAAEERKLKIIADREAKKNGIAPSTAKTTTPDGNAIDKEAAAAQAKQAQADQRAETIRLRQQAVEDRKKAQEEKRLQILADREAKKTGKTPAAASTVATVGNETENPSTKTTEAKTAATDAKQKQAEERAKTLEERKKLAEENKKAQEEKRKQALEAKDTKKTGTVSENTTKVDAKTTDTEKTATTETPAKTEAEIAKEKQAEARAKTIEERNKVIEDRKKALEEKRKKILEDREAAKKANEEKLKTTKENTNNN
jgi:Skp family chaperone for outer membrane proteins